jgi:3-keto-5-aminohexanoate cleavage enzyme
MATASVDQSHNPVVIEAAISAVVANTDGSVLTAQSIIDEAKACLASGAGIIHYHHDFALTNAEAVEQCITVQKGILADYPSTLIYPGYLKGDCAEDQMLPHVRALRDAGALTMFAFDPGLASHGRPDADGLPATSVTGGTTFAQARSMLEYSREADVPCSLGIFEPGALRWARSYGAARKFTRGTIVKFYFAGDQAWGSKGTGVTFGLPPSKAALDIYLSLIEGSGLPWVVTILGGAILETDLARYVLERGGHLRVGAEDPLRAVEMTNVEMVEAVIALADQVGRPVARSTETLSVLSKVSGAVPLAA